MLYTNIYSIAPSCATTRHYVKTDTILICNHIMIILIIIMIIIMIMHLHYDYHNITNTTACIIYNVVHHRIEPTYPSRYVHSYSLRKGLPLA